MRGLFNTVRDLFSVVLCSLLSLVVKRKSERWIFCSSFNTRFNYNSRTFFLFVREQCPDVEAFFVINDEAEREKLQRSHGPHFIETRTLKGKIFALQAGVWITSVGLPVYILGATVRRVVINLWHGMPLKKIGLLQHNLTVVDRFRIRLLHSRSYTSIITTSDFFQPLFVSAFGCRPEVIKALGQPRNDALFCRNEEPPVLAALRKKHASKKILLYAPTFRDGVEPTRLFPFDDFCPVALADWLEQENILLLIRMHQSERGGSNAALEKVSNCAYIGADLIEEANEVLPHVDLLITDFSGIFIDFLLTGKPMLFIPYDLVEYEADRGFLYDYDAYTPGPKVNSFEGFC